MENTISKLSVVSKLSISLEICTSTSKILNRLTLFSKHNLPTSVLGLLVYPSVIKSEDEIFSNISSAF